MQMYVKAATHLVEVKTGRALINRTVKLELPAFPVGDAPILIPLFPLVSVESVEYYDGGGAALTWSDSNYYIDTTSIRPKVVVKENLTYPTTDDRFDAVTVNFTAGYGTSYTSVPEGLRFIVIALASHFYLNRTPVVVGGGAAMEVPKTLGYALDAYKIWEA
jgi:uncharacterized phiE125 gp8 family phage protein